MNLIVILGPTASGKTALAVNLAKRIQGEIISADSRQIFREMNIGTGKDLQEYDTIPYHLIDIRNPGELFNVAEFQDEFHLAYKKITNAGKNPILCGGTGMYIQSVLQNYAFTQIPILKDLRSAISPLKKEELQEYIRENNDLKIDFDISTQKRCIRAIEIIQYFKKNPEISIPTNLSNINYVVFGLNPDREIRRERISTRLQTRFKDGMIEEVQNLLKKGISSDILKFYGLEYKLITEYLINEGSFDRLHQKLETAIFQYAKRQMTFFRKMEKDDIEINWIPDELSLEEKTDYILNNI